MDGVYLGMVHPDSDRIRWNRIISSSELKWQTSMFLLPLSKEKFLLLSNSCLRKSAISLFVLTFSVNL